MSLGSNQYTSGLLSDWVLAPMYNDRLSNSLSLWPPHPNADISLSFPTSLSHPQVSVAQTLVDLTLQKPQPSCIAKREVKELPFAVIKPKAIRLYDIHIGVESRFPVSGHDSGFEGPFGGVHRNTLSCLPSAVGFACKDINSRLKEAPPVCQGDGLASFNRSPSLLAANTATNSTELDKHFSPLCCCYQDGSPSKESRTKTQSSAQNLLPFCLGFPAQLQTQTLFGDGGPNIFGQPILPTPQNNTPWSRRPSNPQGHDSFLPLPATVSVRDNWNKYLHLTRAPQEELLQQHISGLDSSATPILRQGQSHLNCRGRSINQGSQKFFLHPLGSFQKHKDSRERQLQENNCSKNEVKFDHIIDFRTATKEQHSYNKIKSKKLMKSTEKDTFGYKLSSNENKMSKYLKRAYTFKRSTKTKQSNKINKQCPHQNFSNSLEPKRARGMCPFGNDYYKRISVSPLSETARQPESHISGPSLIERKIFRCPQCRYVTDRKNNLKRHIVTMHHTSSKTLECCGIAFQSKAALRDHNSVFHKGGYRCSLCARNFCRKALLRRHLTVHSGQKDFFCEQCGYATSHKSNLERHQKVHVKREVVREIEQVCHPQTNYSVLKINADNKGHGIAPCINAPHATNLGAKSCIAHPKQTILSAHENFSSVENNLETSYPCYKNTFPHGSPMPCDLDKGLVLSKSKCDTINLVKPMPTSKSDTVSNRLKHEFVLHKEEICRNFSSNTNTHCSEKQEVCPEKVSPKFKKRKLTSHPQSYRNHKSRRTRGLLSKRIRETYSNFKTSRPKTKPYFDNLIYKSGLCEVKAPRTDCFQGDQVGSELCNTPCTSSDQEQEVGDIFHSKANHAFGFQENEFHIQEDVNSLNAAEVKPSTKLKTLQSNIEKNVLHQNYMDNLNQLPECQTKNAVVTPLLLPPTSVSVPSNSNTQQTPQQIGLYSPAKRSKKKMCDLIYSCPECDDVFPTQVQLGQHKCFIDTSNSRYCLSLVAAHHKDND